MEKLTRVNQLLAKGNDPWIETANHTSIME